MRWDQINNLEIGDVLMHKDTSQVCEIFGLWMGQANCLLYNVNKSITLNKKDLRKWFIYRRYSANKSKEQLKRKI